MFPGWLKKFMGRMLSSTAAVALGAASLAAAGSAHAVTISTPGGDTPQDAPFIGPVGVGDQIPFSQGLPAYWEFTWNGPAAAADVSSSGTFVGSFAGDPYGNLELYNVTGGSPGNLGVAEFDFTAFHETSFNDFGSFVAGAVAADLGTVGLTTGQDYVVGISSANLSDPTGSIAFNAAATAVPEPASLTLLGSALAFFGLRRRRRKTPA